MGEVISFKKKLKISELMVQIEHMTLEDGSFWYRIYNPLGEYWTDWIKSE